MKLEIRFNIWLRLAFLCVALAGSAAYINAQDNDMQTVESSGGYIKSRGNSKVIVFVHGLFSGPEAWRCDAQHYWPTMIASDEDPAFAQADIYVVKYPTPKKHGRMTLADLATIIYNRMEADGIFSRHQEVIFVAHSMGGILVQQLMVTYVNEKLIDKVHVIFLYGTPQEGSKLANLGGIFNRDPLLKELQAGDDNLLLPDLDQKWLHGGASQIKRFCAYETLPEDGFKVVSRSSATRGCDDEIAMDSNHGKLVKPCSTKEDSYTFLLRKLKEIKLPQTQSPASSPSLPSVPLAQPKSTPYDEVGMVLSNVNNIKQTYLQSASRISQDFASPYKHGRSGPIPKELPDWLLQQLILADQQASNSYASVQPQIMKARQDAIDCFQLTPNELEKDQSQFNSSTNRAIRTTPVNQLEQTAPGIGIERFSPIIAYLTTMHQKLGDYRCSMY